jgi:hypothetical protein
MGISSLKGIGSARRSFVSTATAQNPSQMIILQVTGSGTLKSFFNLIDSQSYTIKISIDGQHFTTFLSSDSFLTGALTSIDKSVSYAACDLSFTESLQIELVSGYWAFQFKYHLEMEV